MSRAVIWVKLGLGSRAYYLFVDSPPPPPSLPLLHFFDLRQVEVAQVIQLFASPMYKVQNKVVYGEELVATAYGVILVVPRARSFNADVPN